MKISSFPIVVLALATATLFSSQTMALTIGFETSEGYSVGELVGQPTSGSQWSSNSGLFSVDATAGVGGGYGAVSDPGYGGFENVRITPSESDLGASGLQSIDYSVDLKLGALSGANWNWNVTLFEDSTGPNSGAALELRVYGDGDVEVLGGGNIAGVFTSPTEFVTFSGTINYTTQTTSMKINGGTENNFSFSSSVGTGADEYGRIEIASIFDSGPSLTIDNLTAVAVPEPSSITLLLSALAGLLLLKRKSTSGK